MRRLWERFWSWVFPPQLDRLGQADWLYGPVHVCEYDDPNKCAWPGHRR